jgi:hypothetical protein
MLLSDLWDAISKRKSREMTSENDEHPNLLTPEWAAFTTLRRQSQT